VNQYHLYKHLINGVSSHAVLKIVEENLKVLSFRQMLSMA